MGEQREHVIIVEDKPHWQQHIKCVLEGVFDHDIEIHLASNTDEALKILETLESTRQKIKAIFTDIHMSDDGKANGDVLLTNLMEKTQDPEYTVPPVAVISGTFMDRQKKELGELIPGVPMFDKGAFRPTAEGSPQRAILIENLRHFVRGEFGALSHNPQALDYLRGRKEELASVSAMGAFIDEVSGWIGTIWKEYGDFLAKINGNEFFKNCSLYDDGRFTGLELHDFKNELPEFIGKIKAAENAPVGLTEELESLRVYISRGLNIIKNEEVAKTVDVNKMIGDTVVSFDDERLFFDENGSDKLEVPVNSRAFQLMLVEIVRNALRYSDFGAHISIDGAVLVICNDSKSGLPFRIEDGKVVDGQLPKESGSSTGSGFGIISIMKAAKELGIDFSMQEESGTVVVQLDFGRLLAKDPEAEEAGGSETAKADSAGDAEACETVKPFRKVVFMCHENRKKPEATFRDLHDKTPPEFEAHYVEFPAGTNIKKWIDANAEIFAETCLIVIHVSDPNKFGEILNPLVERFPHLVILPAGTYGAEGTFPRTLKGQIVLYEIDREEYLATGSVMWPDAPDIASAGLQGGKFFTKDYGAEDWRKILDAANKRAVANAVKE